LAGFILVDNHGLRLGWTMSPGTAGTKEIFTLYIFIAPTPRTGDQAVMPTPRGRLPPHPVRVGLRGGLVIPCCKHIIADYVPYIPWIEDSDLLGTFISFSPFGGPDLWYQMALVDMI
jgi:hypothetical protein